MVTNGKQNHHKVGQPTKISPEIIAQIRDMVLYDCYFDVACRAAGITRQTGYNWKERGRVETERIEKGETPKEEEALYLEFHLTIDQAEAQSELEDIKYIRNGFPDWQAKAWIRERKSRERWGRVDRMEHTGEGGGPVEHVARVEIHENGHNSSTPFKEIISGDRDSGKK